MYKMINKYKIVKSIGNMIKKVAKNTVLLTALGTVLGEIFAVLLKNELGIHEHDIVPNCLIIYPKMENCCIVSAFTEGKPLLPESTPINGFRRFHKICVPVPAQKPLSSATTR